MRQHSPLLVALAALASAQQQYPPVTVTETVSDCAAGPYETLITATHVVTKTWCPACDSQPTGTGSSGSGSGSSSGGGGSGTTYGSGGRNGNSNSNSGNVSNSGSGDTINSNDNNDIDSNNNDNNDISITIYETVLPGLATNGPVWSLTPTTYTITEACGAGASGLPMAAGHVPADFTVQTVQCTACAVPGPVTVTVPCGCRATSGVSLGPLPTANPAYPNGWSGGAGASGSWSGSGSGAGSGSRYGGAAGAGQAARPSLAGGSGWAMATGVVAPGANASWANGGQGRTPAVYTGSAAAGRNFQGYFCAGVAVLAGGLAFVL